MAPDGGRFCAACGESLLPSARFCPGCGSPVPAETAPAELRKTVTLLFCDVAGSTVMGEQLDPEALRGVMGEYFAVAEAAVERHGGTVEKFVGDAVLAVFGIPEVREDDALRAVRAAAEMQRELMALSDRLVDDVGVSLTVRTGVNTGPVIAGPARAGGSFATGDAVNTAARLEQAAGPGEVLLGAPTYALVRDAVEAEPVPPLLVKGKAEPLAAFRLLRVLDTHSGRARRSGGPLVGRERELRALADVLDRARETSRGHLVTVLGGAGIGKSRLVEHFLTTVSGEAQVLRGRCVSYGRGITFWPIVQVLRQATGLAGDEDAATARQRMCAVLGGVNDAGAVVDRLLPLLGLGGEPGGAEETFWAVQTLLERLAATGPVVVAVDDVHWAEPTLLDLLERLRDEARDVPVVLLCQARPELLERRPGWGGGAFNATSFFLEPISADHTRTLLDEVLGPGVPSGVVDAVARWSGGNPLFAEEVVAHLVETRVLVGGSGRWRLAGSLDDVVLPPGVTALLGARLDRLPTDERMVLERLSVAGLEASEDEATTLAGDQPRLRAILDELVRKDLLRRARSAAATTWAFRHVLVREAAYDGLPKTLRADLHVALADRLEHEALLAAGESDAFVGHHLAQAVRLRRELTPRGDDALARRAVETLLRAAGHARDLEDLVGAAGILRRAREVAPDDPSLLGPLLWRLCRAMEEIADFHSALDAAREGEQLAATASELVRDAWRLRVLSLEGQTGAAVDIDEQRALAERLQAQVSADDNYDIWVESQRGLMTAAQVEGHWRSVLAVCEEIARAGSPQDRRAMRYWICAAHLWGPFPVSHSLAVLAEQREARGLGARAAATIDMQTAALLAVTGRMDEAEPLAAAAGPVLMGLDLYAKLHCSFHRVFFLIERGDFEQIVTFLGEVVEESRAAGALGYASTQVALIALAHVTLGRDGEAEVALAETAELTTPQDIVNRLFLGGIGALIAARRGDHEQARLLAPAAEDVPATYDEPYFTAIVAELLAEAAALRGDRSEQRRHLARALELYRLKEAAPRAARVAGALDALDG